MKRVYTVVNDFDGNDTFEVEAESYDEAMRLALEELGWWVSEGRDIDADEIADFNDEDLSVPL